jgi:hypothetical protein
MGKEKLMAKVPTANNGMIFVFQHTAGHIKGQMVIRFFKGDILMRYEPGLKNNEEVTKLVTEIKELERGKK